jgi:hypothetical protein
VQHAAKGWTGLVPLIQADSESGPSFAVYRDDVFQKRIDGGTHWLSFLDRGDAEWGGLLEDVQGLKDQHLEGEDEKNRRHGHGQHAHPGWFGNGSDDEFGDDDDPGDEDIPVGEIKLQGPS